MRVLKVTGFEGLQPPTDAKNLGSLSRYIRMCTDAMEYPERVSAIGLFDLGT